MTRHIVPSITTHSRTGHTWRMKIAEVNALGLREVGLFLTGLAPDERTECYALLRDARRAHDFRVVFVHAVSSMTEREYWELHDSFGAERFNLHPTWQFPLQHQLSTRVRDRIFIENSFCGSVLSAADLDGFAGLCVDLSHLDDSRRGAPGVFENVRALSEHFTVGANHISAVFASTVKIHEGMPTSSSHFAREAGDFAYLAALPTTTFASVAAIELENSLADQVRFIPAMADAFAAALGPTFSNAA